MKSLMFINSNIEVKKKFAQKLEKAMGTVSE